MITLEKIIYAILGYIIASGYKRYATHLSKKKSPSVVRKYLILSCTVAGFLLYIVGFEKVLFSYILFMCLISGMFLIIIKR